MPALRSKQIALFSVLSSLIFVTSCSTTSMKEYQRIHTLQNGAKFMLVKPLPIKKRKASVYIQDGVIKTYPSVDLYAPYCQINLAELTKRNITLKPDNFVVSKFFNYERSVSRDTIEFESLMDLSSQANPTVKYMSCKYQGYPVDGNLTITDIEKTLGDYFKLERINTQQGKAKDNSYDPINNKIGEPYKTGADK